MNVKLNKEVIGKGLNGAIGIAKKSIRVIGPIAVAVMYNKSTIQKVIDEIRYNGNVGYDDVIKAITDSGMYSSDKCRAVELLKADGDGEYYKAIVSIVRSDGYSSSKLAMIETMNKKFGNEGESQA